MKRPTKEHLETDEYSRAWKKFRKCRQLSEATGFRTTTFDSLSVGRRRAKCWHIGRTNWFAYDNSIPTYGPDARSECRINPSWRHHHLLLTGQPDRWGSPRSSTQGILRIILKRDTSLLTQPKQRNRHQGGSAVCSDGIKSRALILIIRLLNLPEAMVG